MEESWPVNFTDTDGSREQIGEQFDAEGKVLEQHVASAASVLGEDGDETTTVSDIGASLFSAYSSTVLVSMAASVLAILLA